MREKSDAAKASGNMKAMAQEAHDALANLIDARLGHTVNDNAVFRAHCAKYEAEFMEDMDALGVRR
jgi:cysteinyl-tRNA synthetase